MPDTDAAGNVAKNHHYLPQCYLRGFARSRSERSKLHVYDVDARRWFVTTTRNVGSVRDFNRVDVDGRPRDALEKALSPVDDAYAIALRRMGDERKIPRGRDYSALMNLIASTAIRNPTVRGLIIDGERKRVKAVADEAFASRDVYEQNLQKMRDAGTPLSDKSSFEEMKRFHESGKYTIEILPPQYLSVEVAGMEAVLTTLAKRTWRLFLAPHDEQFVTCDRPAILHWNDDGEAVRGRPIDHDAQDGVLVFPASKEMALVGQFGGKAGVYIAARPTVARVNAYVAMSAHRQIYGARSRLLIFDRDGRPIDTTDVPVEARQRE